MVSWRHCFWIGLSNSLLKEAAHIMGARKLGGVGGRERKGRVAGREASSPPTFLRYPHCRKNQQSQIKAQQGPEEAFPQRKPRGGLSVLPLHSKGLSSYSTPPNGWAGPLPPKQPQGTSIYLKGKKKKNPHTSRSRIFCHRVPFFFFLWVLLCLGGGELETCKLPCGSCPLSESTAPSGDLLYLIG